jgi:hypothetical protein
MRVAAINRPKPSGQDGRKISIRYLLGGIESYLNNMTYIDIIGGLAIAIIGAAVFIGIQRQVVFRNIIFAIIGISLTIAGLNWLGKTAAFVKQALHTSGTIVDVRARGTAPVFTFTDTARIVHTQEVSSAICTFERGETVEVLHDTSNPMHANINTFSTVWLEPVFIFCFGLLFGLSACFQIFSMSRKTAVESDKMSPKPPEQPR